MGKVTGLLMDKICSLMKAGTPDPVGVVNAMLSRRNGGSAAVSEGVKLNKDRDERTAEEDALSQLAQCYKRAHYSQKKDEMLQFLSLAVCLKGATTQRIMKFFSDTEDGFVLGDQVDIIRGERREKSDQFIVQEIDPGGKFVKVSDVEGLLPADRVFKSGVARCTRHQIKRAKKHARAKYPGAKTIVMKQERVGMDETRVKFVADFLSRDDNVEIIEASMVNAVRGVTKLLRLPPYRLFKKLEDEMTKEGLKPVSWGYFWINTCSTKEYKVMTADNCCCATCRDFGILNYAEIKGIIEDLNESILKETNDEYGLPNKSVLLKAVDDDRHFSFGNFKSHSKKRDGCGWHCPCLLLSTHNDPRFKKECTHRGGVGYRESKPKTMEERIQEELGRKPKKDDWNSVCEVCCNRKSGNLYMCSDCNIVCHRGCAENEHSDMPLSTEKDAYWTCWDCVRDLDEMKHTASCEECNRAGYIMSDIKAAIQSLESLEVLHGTHQAGLDETSREKEPGVVEASASVMLYARLEIAEGKNDLFRAHLIRDGNQGCFKDLALTTLPLNSYYLLMDYWAKIPIRKEGGTACCEGDSVGLSAHGSMFVYRNPSEAERKEIDAEYGPIEWARFGPSPEMGGLYFLEDHLNT